jgi:hypothetical protein
MENLNRKAKARLFLKGLSHEITMIISHSDRHVSCAHKGSAKLRRGMGRAARNTFRTLYIVVCIAAMPECGQVAVFNVILGVEVSARCPVVLTRHTVVRR